MKLFLKFFITFIFINTQYVYSEVYKVDNLELQNLIVSEVPLIDIRTKEEWLSTGEIKNSHLITFFDEYGNYNVEEWEETESRLAPDLAFAKAMHRIQQVLFKHGKMARG